MNLVERFDAAEQRVLHRYNVDAKSRFIDVAAVDGDTHVLVVGDGPPLVMVPGFADPAALWAPLMQHLDGFRLHAVERPCFGRTGYARHEVESMRRLAVDFLEQTLDELGLERAGFVANSIGSLWCLWFALDRPERVTCMSHIGCPATLLGTGAPLPMRLLSVPIVGRLLTKMSPPSAKQVHRFASMARVDLSNMPELVDLLIALQGLPGVGEAICELVSATVRLRGARPEVALRSSQLKEVSQPVQYIWGENDPFGSLATGGAAAEFTPEAEFHVVEGAGHLPWIMDAEFVARVATPFLRAHS